MNKQNNTVNLILNIGKDSDSSVEKGLAHNVMMTLVSGLEGKGYCVYTDNFYTSPSLFTDLHHNGFDACGTVRLDRKGITETFKKKVVSKPYRKFLALCMQRTINNMHA